MSRMSSGNDRSGLAASQAGGSPGPVVPPRSLADIPGIGPIRVRMLEKAGWGSLTKLRQANLDALLAVPGLTEVKARQIQQYLERFRPEDLAPPERVGDLHPPEGVSDQDGGATEQPNSGMSGASQVVQRATRAMGEVITVLLSPEAPQFRSRFLRILGQFAQCAESIATDAPYLSDEQQERAIRRLRRAAKALSELTGATAADRKAQGRLADALEEITNKLDECRLSS